jgi:polyhydroxyalkanoate synthase
MTSVLLESVRSRPPATLSHFVRLWQNLLAAPFLTRQLEGSRGFTTPHHVVHRDGSMRLLRFHRDSPPVWAEPLLVCSAPVSRPSILDLRPSRSVVAQMVAEGFDTYLIDWGVATPADRSKRLSDYLRSVRTAAGLVRGQARVPQLHFVGYCLGGTLATIVAALEPATVKSLTLMAAPIDLARDASLLKAWADERGFDVDSLIDAYGNCPGPLLRACFAMTEPARNFYGKFDELARRMHDDEYVESFAALEAWTNASVTVAGEVFRDIVKSLYQRNELVRGQLVHETTRVHLGRIACPVLIMTASADHLVSPAASVGLVPHICSRDVKVMSLEGGHESLAVSAKAHRTFWPEAVQWIADHSTRETGPSIRPVAHSNSR